MKSAGGRLHTLAKKKNRRECENARTDRHRAEKEPSACVQLFGCFVKRICDASARSCAWLGLLSTF